MHKKSILLGQQGHGQKKFSGASPPTPHSPFCRYTNANTNESFLNESSMVAVAIRTHELDHACALEFNDVTYVYTCALDV